MSRVLVPALLGVVLIAACSSTPFPPPQALSAATPPTRVATLAQPRVVPIAGQPGFRVCVDCGPVAPTPKTLGGARKVAATSPMPAERGASSAAPEPVTVRYAASIPFAFGSTRIGAAGRAALDAFIARLPGGVPSAVSVAGRTDSVGPRAVNARIARARAEAVLAALRSQLKPRSEEITSKPLCCYIASNATAAGRADNRRVDVVALVEIQ